MGLDMFLTGHRYFHRLGERKPTIRARGAITAHLIDLGVWHKHPVLHGFIVETFADGEDERREIDLSADALRRIIAAIETGELPAASYPWFVQGKRSRKKRDLSIFREALAWLEAEDEVAWRSIRYEGGW